MIYEMIDMAIYICIARRKVLPAGEDLGGVRIRLLDFALRKLSQWRRTAVRLYTMPVTMRVTPHHNIEK